ncbi:MAG: PSD1 and planctomycete cytochrome C domain-containing protein [Planctomycetaceae bacterium]
MNPLFRSTTMCLTAAICCYSLPARAQDTTQQVNFAREVLPIFSNKCFVCHGPDGQEKDVLRLDSFEAATHDHDGRRAIDPQKLVSSEILARIGASDSPMPPADADKQLSDTERDVIRRWILQGGKYARHWSFVPPRKQPPRNSPDQRVDKADMIDAFIQSRLAHNELTFAAEAQRSVLARRAALVLTGLPPEPRQLQAFLNDQRPDAYPRLVEQLLDSPRYGEHQGRYWLDAVRYGDTHGLHLDNRRGIYPYRDWVIRALNQNLPLDTFITWQLAGDLLPQPNLQQRVATGFVRMNPSTAEGGAIPAEFQAKNNFDRTETLGTVLLGMTLTCSRCHSHKFDPISQTEYYRLLAFFNSTAEHSMDGNAYTYGPVIKAPQHQAAWTAWESLVTERGKLLSSAAAEIDNLKLSEEQSKSWSAGSPSERLALIAKPDGPFSALPLHMQAQDLGKRIQTAEKSFTTTLVARDLPQPRATRVLRRGEYNLPVGQPLQPGIPNVMGGFPRDAPRNRLGLARWLTGRDHPLVARVLVNRIWQRTFGEALVRTPEDFGLQGQQPTHPQLLDWLAVELHDSGWDLKHMLRLMLNSRTFRQASSWRANIDDPANLLWARGPGYRLDAEVLRDMGLWSSGLLDPQMGGEGVKPYQPSGMWLAMAHPGSNTKLYVRDKGRALYRRSIYVYWKRTSPHPMMTLFDAPNRESSCVRRSRTNTSLQSLGLLNEVQRIEMSRMLAERLMQQANTDQQRLNLLFELLACRKPTAVEHAACVRLLQAMRHRYSQSNTDAVALLSVGEIGRNTSLAVAEHAAWTQVAVTVLASDVTILMY